MAVEVRFAAIADDYTGASDLAGMLHEERVNTVQMFGVPDAAAIERVPAATQAVVVSLKTRSLAPEHAAGMSLSAYRELQRLRPRQLQFKYCSTFDSTPRGNIGPVAEALLDAAGAASTVAVPALPVNGRTQYLGHLFVSGRLLAESPLRDHPLNPMTDSNLVRWLQQQTRLQVGLVSLSQVRSGAAAVRAALERSAARISLVDATCDDDLTTIAEAVAGEPLITGGSGLAQPLARLWYSRAEVRSGVASVLDLPNSAGTLVLAGSCSAATREQLEQWERSGQRIQRVSAPGAIAPCYSEVQREIAAGRVAAIASSAAPGEQVTGAGEAFERGFAELAARAVDEGVASAVIVAGGETSGAVIDRLHIKSARVMSIVAPGVPSLLSLDDRRLWLVLKSGNFGGRDFFERALIHRQLLCT